MTLIPEDIHPRTYIGLRADYFIITRTDLDKKKMSEVGLLVFWVEQNLPKEMP